MFYFMHFSDLAAKISPSVLEEYLKNTGWHLFPRKRKDIRVYQITKDDGSFFQVTIPLDENLADYKYAMAEAVKTIADNENQPLERLLLSLAPDIFL